MTPEEHKAKLKTLRSNATKARTKLRTSNVTLAEKLVLKSNVNAADEAIHHHCANYYNLVRIQTL